jgi:hypothetical protein
VRCARGARVLGVGPAGRRVLGWEQYAPRHSYHGGGRSVCCARAVPRPPSLQAPCRPSISPTHNCMSNPTPAPAPAPAPPAAAAAAAVPTIGAVCSELMLGALRTDGSIVAPSALQRARAGIDDENAWARQESETQRERFRGASFSSGLQVRGRVGASSTTMRSGSYGVNSVVYEAVWGSVRCAVKGLIIAHGPFDPDQGAMLAQATVGELRQPPHSPHLLQYWTHFDAVIEGDPAKDWPTDVQTTPRGSLTTWLCMPLLVDGNLQTFSRVRPLHEEHELLDCVGQLMRGVVTLADHGMLHRDIKLDNVLVKQRRPHGRPQLAAAQHRLQNPWLFVLADFGTMETMQNQLRGCTAGNPMKVAPELRTLADLNPEQAQRVDLTKAEVWACAVLFFDRALAASPMASL